MSGIDWSKAPEGATHYDARGNCCSVGFMKPGLRTGEWEYFGIGGHWILYGLLHREIMDAMVERPKAQDWTGEGLPPVGIGAEVLFDSIPLVYVSCKILAHDEDRAVYRFTSGPRKGEYGSDLRHFTSGNKIPMFRPIRTPAQLAAEEREEAIKQFMQIGDIYWDTASALYDAGARLPGRGAKA